MLIKRKNLASRKSQLRDRNQPVLSPSAQAIQVELNKVKQQAKQVREEAEKVLTESQKKLIEAEEKAKQIIEQAELDARDIKERVYEESVNAFNAEAEAVRSEAKALFKDLFEVKREALIQAHQDIIKIALDLAEKIIRYQANIDPEILKTQVIESIKKATSESERVQVFVNPQDLQKLEDNVSEIEKLFPAGISIVPLSNEAVDIGSCIIETKSGQLDARFSTQLMTLIKLCEHLEVAEPILEVSEPSSVPETAIQVTPFEELPEVKKAEEVKMSLQEHEKELLEEGLLSEEELSYREVKESEVLEGKPSSSLTEEEELLRRELLEDNFDELEAKLNKMSEEIIAEENKSSQEIKLDIDEPEKEYSEEVHIEIKPQIEPQIEEKPSVEDNQGLFIEYEEEEELEKPDKIDTKGILKPKKKPYKIDFNELADEVEKNPEWKEMLDDEG